MLAPGGEGGLAGVVNVARARCARCPAPAPFLARMTPGFEKGAVVDTADALGFVGAIADAISDYPLSGSARLSAIRTKSGRDFAPIFFMTL
jgi:hypothetical protein